MCNIHSPYIKWWKLLIQCIAANIRFVLTIFKEVLEIVAFSPQTCIIPKKYIAFCMLKLC
jgi:hypothetical protein